MSRYIRDIELHLPKTDVETEVYSFLQNAGFYPSDWKGEQCFCADYRPNGIESNIKGYQGICFFKSVYENGVLHMEAWVRDGKASETGLTGFYNVMMKQPYLNQIVGFENTLISKLPENSELRRKYQVSAEAVRKENSKMGRWRQVVYTLALLAFFWALFSCLFHLGIL